MFFNKMRDVFLITRSKKTMMQFQIVLGMISKIKLTQQRVNYNED